MNRQIELAKSILESAGYKVTKQTKRLKESVSNLEWTEDDRGNFLCDLDKDIIAAVGPEGDGTWWVEIEDEKSGRVVHNRNPLTSKEEAMAWVEKWAARRAKRVKPKGIPEEVKSNCLDFSYFTPKNGYSEEETEMYREEFGEYAEALGISLENLLICSEEDEGVNYVQEMMDTAKKIKNILYAPGVMADLYSTSDGTRIIHKNEFGYDTYFFAR